MHSFFFFFYKIISNFFLSLKITLMVDDGSATTHFYNLRKFVYVLGSPINCCTDDI